MEEIRKKNFHPWMEPQIASVLHGDMGLCAGKVTMKDISSSSPPSVDDPEKNDTFTICIPYAGSSLQWQVMFNGNDPEELPDFLISDLDGFDPDFEEIPSLMQWNPNEPMSLLNVLKDLLRLYKLHHLQQLANTGEKIGKDVHDLISSNEYPFTDVLVDQEENVRFEITPDVINILIQIRPDFSEIPADCYEDAPPQDPTMPYPILHIKTAANSGKIRPLLYMSPRMEHVLGGRNSMKLPSYYHETTQLLDYVQTVQRNLQSLINVLKEGHTKRREYIAAFLRLCPDSILEYDAVNFNSISLLFTHEDFYFIVHATLSKYFPLEQPKLTLQSVYHVTRRGALYQVVHSSYPYSPRWQGSEMVKRTRSYILQQIDSFKTGCLKNGII